MSRGLARAIVVAVAIANVGSAKESPAPEAVGFDHAKHRAALVKARQAALRCDSCHDAARATASPTHRACFGRCHGKPPARQRSGARARINAHQQKVCVSCHAERDLVALVTRGTALPPVTLPLPVRKRAAGRRDRPFPVDKAFSHVRHRTRVTDCSSCHGGGAQGSPRPPRKAACARCHDGAKAFSMVEARCRSCHLGQRNHVRRHTAPLVRFSHKSHRQRGKLGACAGCHPLTGNGTPLTPARNHAPCSDAGCHREQFKSRTPRICNACHIASEPWRPLHADRGPPAETELGARFNHKAHLSRSKSAALACSRCHKLASGSRELRLPRDHAACMGAGCHQQSTTSAGARPALSECTRCHQHELVRAHQLRRHMAKWSVRTRFRHAPHRAHRGKPVACTTCHRQMMASTGLRDVRPPTKHSCVPCHDGTQAFKITGHGCARCHGGKR